MLTQTEVLDNVIANPSRSLRKFTADTGLSASSVHKGLKVKIRTN